MDDLKIPVFLLICILGGVGFFFYNKSKNPVVPKVKPTKTVVEEVSEEEKAEKNAEEELKVIKSAKAAFAKEKYQETINILKGKENTQNYDIQSMLAYCYSSLKDYDKSILFFEKALKIKKIPLDGYSLAYLYELTGRFSAAASLYLELAEEPLPTNLKKSVLEGIARVSLYLPNNKDLEKYMVQLVDDWPDSKDGIINLIKYKKQIESFNYIDSLADSVNKNFSNNYSYNYELAQLYEAAGNNNQAVSYYKKCIKLDSKNYTPFLDCYNNLMKMNKKEAAVKALEYYLDSGQIFPKIYFEASLIAYKSKLYRQAIRLYMIAVSSEPKYQGLDDVGLVSEIEKIIRDRGTESEKVFINAFICYLNGDYKYASSEINRVKSELDNSIYKYDYKVVLKACDKLSQIDKKRDDEIKAYDDYLRAQEEAALKKKEQESVMGNSKLQDLPDKEIKARALKNNSNYEIQLETANEFIRRGKLSEAKIYFRNASSINKQSYLPHHELAKIYMMENNIQAAQTSIGEALKRNSKDAGCLALGASISYNNNNYDKAKEYAESAISIDPKNTLARIVNVQLNIAQKNFDKANEEVDKALSFEKTNMMRAELLRLKQTIKEQKEKDSNN